MEVKTYSEMAVLCRHFRNSKCKQLGGGGSGLGPGKVVIHEWDIGIWNRQFVY